MIHLPRVSYVLLVALLAVVTLAGLWLARAGDASPTPGDASKGGWQTIEHEGLLVDVPSTWQRTDTSGCEFEIPRWGDPAVSPCAFRDGVTFYASATFDPAHGPGVVRSLTDGEVTWSGYHGAGDFVVYVFEHADQRQVRAILASVRE